MNQKRPYLAVAILLVLLALAVATRHRRGWMNSPPAASTPRDAAALELAHQLSALEASRQNLDQTLWAKERLAERCGRVIEDLWDLLNHATNQLPVAANFELPKITLPQYQTPQTLPHAIQLFASPSQHTELNRTDWERFLQQKIIAGWQLARVEFRHNTFDTDAQNHPVQSVFYFAANLINAQRNERAFLEGNVRVQWNDSGEIKITAVDATDLKLVTRAGDPPFQEIFSQAFTPPARSYFIDPLLVYDFAGSGQPSIILAAANVRLQWQPGDRFESSVFCPQPPPDPIFTGVIADFDGDGKADFLCATFEGLTLFSGSERGTFDQSGRRVWTAPTHLKYAQVITCGDLDHDGHLDVYLGQYKEPYRRGQMPTPFDDANDGNPGYLLKNDGHGNFNDVTTQSGLANARRRRCYSASFADLNHDGHPDLLLVSDFAGADLYLNDGHGNFHAATNSVISNAHSFGMAHVFSDFNSDGLLDLLVIGMNSPTASRLIHAGLTPSGQPQFLSQLAAVTYGNRAYLGTPDGTFKPAPFADAIARTGWSWGVSAPDFDNDGFPDLYIANGHESGNYSRDYDSEFWLHDIHVATSLENVVTDAYFQKEYARTRGHGWSYGGNERNRLFMNLAGTNFLEVGWLLGVALPEDCRNVVSADLDGDGKMDLLVTTFEVWPQPRQTLHIFRNRSTDSGNWLGIHLPDQPGAPSPIGAEVTLNYAGHHSIRQRVTGDSYRSQHPNTLHFGLGTATKVDSFEIRWPDGKATSLPTPEINRYHTVHR